MVAATVGAELAVVNVIGPVTIATAVAGLLHCLQRLPMACVAGDRDVGTVEREVCQRVVVELPGLPVDGVVAGCAVAGVASLVRIFFRVAIDAQLRGVPEAMRFVARLTSCIGMPAQQRKAGQVMVEE